jgi:hypothetical protein
VSLCGAVGGVSFISGVGVDVAMSVGMIVTVPIGVAPEKWSAASRARFSLSSPLFLIASVFVLGTKLVHFLAGDRDIPTFLKDGTIHADFSVVPLPFH